MITRPTARRVPLVRTWCAATPVQRIVWYLQWSVYLLPFAVPVALLAGALRGGTPVTMIACAMAVAVACAAHVVQRRTLVAKPQPPAAYRRPLLVCAIGCVAIVALTVGLDDPTARAAQLWTVCMLITVVAAPSVSSSVGLGFVLASGAVLASVDNAGRAAMYTVLLLVVLGTVKSTMWMLSVIDDLDRARRTEAALSVAEERLRFSRDVHDVIGRSLSAIAVKSELAARLSERGDERAAAQMLEVRGLAHHALREARELARGYRESNLQAELDGARSLLEHAGIACDIAGGAAELEPARREPAAWVVREAVTNVIRHSEAARVTIGIEPGSVTVRNDGARDAPAADGTGLISLRQRLAGAGARLDSSYDDGTFTVTAQFGTNGQPGKDAQ